jgi:hypothetical protein
MMPRWHARFRCWALGHRWVGEHRADPVIPLFIVCARCGKFERLTVNDAIAKVFGPRSTT